MDYRAENKSVPFFPFTEEEKDILSHFQDINHNDQRIADHAWLQSFWQESGVAGGVLAGGAAGMAAAGEKSAAASASNAAKPNANSTSALTDGEAGFSNLPSAKGALTPKDFPEVSTKISQRQNRHTAGTQQLEERAGGGFLNSVSDAQKVLDAYHAGQVKILGKNAQGFPVVKFEGVTGTNVNVGVGITDQPTSVFIIKGTTKPSIVPTNPNWSPR